MTISIDDLRLNEAIYVKSSAGSGRMAGDVNFPITGKDGKDQLITVPKTFIPVCITDFAPASMYIDSPDFRRIVASGLLTIMSKEEANKELNTTEGRLELERLRKELFSGIDFSSKENKKITALEAVTQLGQPDLVNIRIKDIMMRNDIDTDQKLVLLRAEETVLTKDDLDFIIGIVEDKSNIWVWADKLRKGKDGILASGQ